MISRILWVNIEWVPSVSSSLALVWQVSNCVDTKGMEASSPNSVQFSKNLNTFVVFRIVYTFLSKINVAIDMWSVGSGHVGSGTHWFFVILGWFRSGFRNRCFWVLDLQIAFIEESAYGWVGLTAWWAGVSVDNILVVKWLRFVSTVMIISVTPVVSVLSVVSSSFVFASVIVVEWIIFVKEIVINETWTTSGIWVMRVVITMIKSSIWPVEVSCFLYSGLRVVRAGLSSGVRSRVVSESWTRKSNGWSRLGSAISLVLCYRVTINVGLRVGTEVSFLTSIEDSIIVPWEEWMDCVWFWMRLWCIINIWLESSSKVLNMCEFTGFGSSEESRGKGAFHFFGFLYN